MNPAQSAESVALTWEEILAYAAAGTCWICGRSGYRKLSQHLAMVHDLKADEVREQYGLAWSQGLCSPEYSEQAREQSIRADTASNLPRGTFPLVRGRKQPQTRAAMKNVADRAHVKEQLRQRNRDPEFNALRAEGLRRSDLAAAQRAAAREGRWKDGKPRVPKDERGRFTSDRIDGHGRAEGAGTDG